MNSTAFDNVAESALTAADVPAIDTDTATASPTLAGDVLVGSAEVIPFPLRRTSAWRIIAGEYARRPTKGRYDKTAYATKVISGNGERLEKLGVAPARIADEIADLETLFRSDAP